ncbi:uncharacterized protein F4812DRAFT_136571 [Daldinia caldariorum]|uniref:uncharacterized protein n=1 Tax=Daldinia caldariorum TaxID=326644 RepID=UPI0020079584|nr:uncharacterized protein F4812DRAFT_136571 [Daldinia caldariorum]KAI1465206.1 hypothetical protein F4812DRAFT_136571 [Daldinia caldariorum]
MVLPSIETPQASCSPEVSPERLADLHRRCTKLERAVNELRARYERNNSQHGPKSRPEDVLAPEVLAMPFSHVLRNFSKFDGVDQAHLRFFFREAAIALDDEPGRNAGEEEQDFDSSDGLIVDIDDDEEEECACADESPKAPLCKSKCEAKADAPADCKTSAACCASQKAEQKAA